MSSREAAIQSGSISATAALQEDPAATPEAVESPPVMEAMHLMRSGSRGSPDRDPHRDPLERNGTMVIGFAGGLGAIYLLIAGPEIPIVLCVAFAVIAWAARAKDYHSWYGRTMPPSKVSWFRRVCFFFALALIAPVFHGATGKG